MISNIREVGQNLPALIDDQGDLLLIQKICSGESCIALLEEEPHRIHEVDDKGYTALHWAAYFNNREAAEVLVEAHPPIIALKSTRGLTALHLSCQQGSVEVVDFLVLKTETPMVSETNQWNETPLHLAAQNGHEKVIQKILHITESTVFSQACDAVDKWGRTPAIVASENGHSKLAAFLQSRSTIQPASVTAVAVPQTAPGLPQGFLQALKKKSSGDTIEQN